MVVDLVIKSFLNHLFNNLLSFLFHFSSVLQEIDCLSLVHVDYVVMVIFGLRTLLLLSFMLSNDLAAHLVAIVGIVVDMTIEMIRNTIAFYHCLAITFKESIVAFGCGALLKRCHHLRVSVHDLLSSFTTRSASVATLIWLFFCHVVSNLDSLASI